MMYGAYCWEICWVEALLVQLMGLEMETWMVLGFGYNLEMELGLEHILAFVL